jgi:two-component system, OmpR family, sensor histidine kinase BaeS
MRLFWKLFLLQLVAAAAVLAGALLLSRSYSVRGFAEYLEARERDRVHEFAAQLAAKVEEGQDLAAAFEALRAARHPRPAPPAPPPPAPEAAEAPAPPASLAAPAPPDAPRAAPERPDTPRADPERRKRLVVRRHIEATPPLQLLDADGAFVSGDPRVLPPQRERQREPIEVDGKVVGYLAWPPVPRHPAQEAFAHQQARHLAVIAPLGLLVAAAFAALITALIVRPIRQLSAGAGALTRREFGTRLPEGRRDEIGQLAADFNRLAAALEGFDRRQRQWLADIAHELRTPLAVLRGEVEAAIEGVRTLGPDMLESLRQEVERIEALVNDLHTVSLAESGGLRLNLAVEDIGALASHSAQRFAARLRAKGFELKVDTPPGLPARVDVQRLDQVLGNLLNNALAHAAPPGPVTVSARLAGEHVLLSVSDAGPGVPDDSLPRLFDRLYRVDSARTRSGGTGLGLSICKSIVEAHGGTIEARKSAAGGLEVVVRLPVAGMARSHGG